MAIPVRAGDLAELAPDWESVIKGIAINPSLRDALLDLRWPVKVIETSGGLARLDGLKWGRGLDTVDIRRLMRSGEAQRGPEVPATPKEGPDGGE